MDEFAEKIEGYNPENADKYRSGASMLLNKLFDAVLDKKLEFIMDGTFSSRSALKNIERTLKRGYLIKIIYVYQDPKLAWEFTLAREKVEHRAINIEGFIEAYFDTLKNLKEIIERNYSKVTIDLILKDDFNKVGKWAENIGMKEIDEILKKDYNKKSLYKYISSKEK